jgi:predicted DNA-binding transcriptional regulator AlpA
MTIDGLDLDELISIKEACRLLGGFHVCTYYRGVAAGRYPKPVHPSPNIARVSKRRVLEVRDRIIAEGEAA